MADAPTHVRIRNRTTGGVWDCPAAVVEEVLDSDNPFMGKGWTKAAEAADLTNEPAAVAATTTAKER